MIQSADFTITTADDQRNHFTGTEHVVREPSLFPDYPTGTYRLVDGRLQPVEQSPNHGFYPSLAYVSPKTSNSPIGE